MARTILTDAAVRRMRLPASGRLEVWDAALPGFGVRVTETGKRSWELLTRLRGRPVRLTLGSWPATSLSKARDLAREAIHDIARGVDPRRKRAVSAINPKGFEHAATTYIEKWAKVRKKTWKEDERIFNVYINPRWQGRRLDEITRTDVVELGDAIAADNGPIMANRALAAVKTMLAWALNRGMIDTHPAALLKGPGKETSRDRVLIDAEIKKLWSVWADMAYPWGTALQLLLLTAARRGEVGTMRWAEIDLGAKLWTLPAERSKNALPLLVPLSTPAIELLAAVPRLDGCEYVFSTRRNRPVQGWSKAIADAIETAGFNGWRVHDLRRTVRTGLSRLGVAADIAERVLGHVMPGVRGVYDRHDYLNEKREALERWGAHVTALVAKTDA